MLAYFVKMRFWGLLKSGYELQVPATFPVLAAAHKALLAHSRDSLSTRTLHSELIYNYSGSKHVSCYLQFEEKHVFQLSVIVYKVEYDIK